MKLKIEVEISDEAHKTLMEQVSRKDLSLEEWVGHLLEDAIESKEPSLGELLEKSAEF
jgi:predicted HicB family RNase H-like nuclease